MTDLKNTAEDSDPVEPVVMLNFTDIADEDFEKMAEEGKTWADIQSIYVQPKWCSYTNALSGAAGCWSLTGRSIKSIGDCGACDCIRNST